MRKKIEKLIRESIAVKEKLLECTEEIFTLAKRIIDVLKEDGVVYLFGNGGSAADAQHIAAELSGRFLLDRSPLPAVALTTNTSAITAIANDYGFDSVFSRQLEGLITPKDIAIGITTSGKSPNVLRALRRAKELNASTAALTGNFTDSIRELCDIVVAVPSSSTPRIQEAHILIGHIICELVEKGLFA
ncbi:MAG: D-sedoheptulose 7-phosphate isomerase [Planctomycetota bacterium]|nr:D-sedoheptulose 7-phosphate isomerase [Planctomycetota bacterium]